MPAEIVISLTRARSGSWMGELITRGESRRPGVAAGFPGAVSELRPGRVGPPGLPGAANRRKVKTGSRIFSGLPRPRDIWRKPGGSTRLFSKSLRVSGSKGWRRLVISVADGAPSQARLHDQGSWPQAATGSALSAKSARGMATSINPGSSRLGVDNDILHVRLACPDVVLKAAGQLVGGGECHLE